MQPEPTTVKIFGQEYAIRSEGDPDYVRRIAAYLDDRMTEVSRQSNQVSSLRVAILAALNITDELFQAREAGSEGAEELRARAEALAHRLEAEILAETSGTGASGSPSPESDESSSRAAAEGDRADDPNVT